MGLGLGWTSTFWAESVFLTSGLGADAFPAEAAVLSPLPYIGGFLGVRVLVGAPGATDAGF